MHAAWRSAAASSRADARILARGLRDKKFVPDTNPKAESPRRHSDSAAVAAGTDAGRGVEVIRYVRTVSDGGVRE